MQKHDCNAKDKHLIDQVSIKSELV